MLEERAREWLEAERRQREEEEEIKKNSQEVLAALPTVCRLLKEDNGS